MHGPSQYPHTNIDALAARGMRFDRTYVQSPIWWPSWMSTYAGRDVGSHGARWNGHPLRVGEMTLDDRLRHLCPDKQNCNLTMVFDGRWKFIWIEAHLLILYYLQDDPKELTYLGASTVHAEVIDQMKDHKFAWTRQMHSRVAISDAARNATMVTDEAHQGVYRGVWDESQLNQ